MTVMLHIGGVPEHFSEPIYQLLAEQSSFGAIHFTWHDYPTGTGAMVADLLTGKLDLAIALTEGLIYAISKNFNTENTFKIIHPFVNSPLVWGVHTAIPTPNITPQDTIAISRIGSGSHIMSLVYAHRKGWKTAESQFLTIGNLAGGIDALENNNAQRFMWEKLMAKPYIDANRIKRIDECPTPWASFMMVCNQKIAETQKKDISIFLEKLREKTISFQTNKENISNNIQKIAKKFNLTEEDVTHWWHNTQWASDNLISEKDINTICDILVEIGLSLPKSQTENIKFLPLDFINTDFCNLKN